VLYKVFGYNDKGQCFATDIKAKSPFDAAKRAIGNIIKRVERVIIWKDNTVLKSWKMENERLIRTI
jgi:hypothetical protein